MRSITFHRRALTLIGAGALCLAVAGAVASTASGSGIKSKVVVKAHTSATFGTYLTTVSGMPLYTSTHDRKDHSSCTGGCLAAWPALTVGRNIRPTGTTGLGTFKRPGGKIQVTWHGWPLYAFGSDAVDSPTGNGVNGFKLVVLKAPKGGGTTTTTTAATTTTTVGGGTTTTVGGMPTTTMGGGPTTTMPYYPPPTY